MEIDSGGFAQSFSLLPMHRVGAQPQALYRSPTGWQVKEAVGETIALPAPDPKWQLPNAKLPITVGSVRLSYFGPLGPTDTPAAGSGA